MHIDGEVAAVWPVAVQRHFDDVKKRRRGGRPPLVELFAPATTCDGAATFAPHRDRGTTFVTTIEQTR